MEDKTGKRCSQMSELHIVNSWKDYSFNPNFSFKHFHLKKKKMDKVSTCNKWMKW